VVVSNPIGMATSQPAQLAVLLQPVLINATILPNRKFQLQLQGSPNRTYIIEGSGNLLDWSPLATLTYTNAPTPFAEQTIDNTNRFYRARVTVP